MRGVFVGALTAGCLLAATARGQEIFWTDTLGRAVYTAGFDGSNPHTILTNHPEEPRSIAVDPLGRNPMKVVVRKDCVSLPARPARGRSLVRSMITREPSGRFISAD